jgi:hypothetical protein
MRTAAVFVTLLTAGALASAARVPLQLSQQQQPKQPPSNSSQLPPQWVQLQRDVQAKQSSSNSSQLPAQWAQLQRDLQANQSRNNGSHAEFVMLAPLQRLPKLQVEGAQPLEQQAADKPAATMTSSADCGKPWAPCGSAIPAGVRCEKGAGWCQPGYYCGACAG